MNQINDDTQRWYKRLALDKRTVNSYLAYYIDADPETDEIYEDMRHF